jgi:hypothetical protein
VKVRELFENFDPKALSETEFDHLPAPNADNINDRYKVGKVAFDNKDGLGAVPNNQEVKYFGFVMMISPSEFLEHAAPDPAPAARAKRLHDLIVARTPIGAPFLNIKYNEAAFKKGESLKVQVVGHDGRGRMHAIQSLDGNTKIPVHVVPRGELRARHLDEKFFAELRKVGMVPEKQYGDPKPLDIGKIYWMGKTL